MPIWSCSRAEGKFRALFCVCIAGLGSIGDIRIRNFPGAALRCGRMRGVLIHIRRIRGAGGLPRRDRRSEKQAHHAGPANPSKSHESVYDPSLKNRPRRECTGGDRAQDLRILEYCLPDRRTAERFFRNHNHVSRLQGNVQCFARNPPVISDHGAVRTNRKNSLLVCQVCRAARLHQIPPRALSRPVGHRRGAIYLPLHEYVTRTFRNHENVPRFHRDIPRQCSPNFLMSEDSLNGHAARGWADQRGSSVVRHCTSADSAESR